jgi:peroxiredoxin
MSQRDRSMVTALNEASALNGPLARRLAFYTAQHHELNPDVALAYQRLIDRFSNAGTGAGGLGSGVPNIGDPMPPFLLPDDQGRLVSRGDLQTDGPLVVSFNRGHWCGYCGIELRALADAKEELDALNANVVAIVPERQIYARRLKTKHGIGFPVLSDIDNAYALSLGLMTWVGEELRGILQGYQIDLARFQGSEGWFLPIPATIVINSDGRVRARHVDPDYRRRMDIEDILAAIAS